MLARPWNRGLHNQSENNVCKIRAFLSCYFSHLENSYLNKPGIWQASECPGSSSLCAHCRIIAPPLSQAFSWAPGTLTEILKLARLVPYQLSTSGILGVPSLIWISAAPDVIHPAKQVWGQNNLVSPREDIDGTIAHLYVTVWVSSQFWRQG